MKELGTNSKHNTLLLAGSIVHPSSFGLTLASKVKQLSSCKSKGQAQYIALLRMLSKTY